MNGHEKSRCFLQKLLRNHPELPFEPDLLPKLFAVTREDSLASLDDLVQLIERSQKLASRVLVIANSAAYGLQYKVSSLRRAVTILGFREIRLLTIMVGMSSLIRDANIPKSFSMTALWRHQLLVAVIAKALAAALGGASGVCGPSAPEDDRLSIAPDEAYVAGLMHDIGKVFFAATSPDIWEMVELLWKNRGGPYFETENAYWGMDHALIGAEVMNRWQFPLLLTEPINWHHAPELAPCYKMEARLLAAANLIAHSGMGPDGGLCAEAAALLPPHCDPGALHETVATALAAADVESILALVA